MSSDDCTIPEHIRAKRGYCDDCGGCKKCPPGSHECSANHIGSHARRQSHSPNERSPKQKQGATKSRRAKVVAKQINRDIYNNEGTEDIFDHQDYMHIASVEDLLKALGINSDLKRSMQKNANERTIGRWVTVMEQILNACLKICVVGGNIHELKKALTISLAKKLNDEICSKVLSSENNKKVVENVLELAKNGSTMCRQTALGILSISCSKDVVNEMLKCADYPEARRKRALENKKDAEENKRRKLQNDSTFEPNDQPQSTPSTQPANAMQQWEDITWKSFRAYRMLMYDHLLKGHDPPKPPSTTKINPDVILQCIQWIANTFQYRPGKLHNFRLNGTVLKNLPVYIRDGGSIKDMHEHYAASVKVQGKKALGRPSFANILHALTSKPTLNAGLSYYYVEFMDLISTLKDMLDSIEYRLEDPFSENCKSAIQTARTEVESGAQFMKYHLKNSLKESSENLFECCTYALGGKCSHREHTEPSNQHSNQHTSPNSPLARALCTHTSIQGLADALNGSNLSEEEQTSITNIAKLTEKEFLHYAKHLCRDWWQHEQMTAIKARLGKDEAVLIIDHKQKILPTRQNESQTEYYGKSGISLCGAMLLTKVEDDEESEKVIFDHRFVDVIMHDVNTQNAPDVFAVFDTILRLFKEEYNISRLSIMSDNAGGFSSFVHIPFMNMCNKHPDTYPQILRWDYTEPQCGKSMLDTHFSFVNLQLRRALIDGIDVNNSADLYTALTHEGGIRSTTVLLVEKLDAATESSKLEDWNANFKKVKIGVRSTASIVFLEDKVTLHHASGLHAIDEVPTQGWKTDLCSMGKELRRGVAFYNTPLRARKKRKSQEDQEDNADQTQTFAVVLRNQVDRHLLMTKERTKNATAQTRDEGLSTANIRLEPHWAKKESRGWTKLSNDVQVKLTNLYNQGELDRKNKVNAEVASRILRDGDLKVIWDQRYLCSATKVKQFYSTVKSKMKTKDAKLAKSKKKKANLGLRDPTNDTTSQVEMWQDGTGYRV